MRAEDRHLGSFQKNETVLFLGPKCPIAAGTPLANLAPVKAEARNKTDPIYVLRSKTDNKREYTLPLDFMMIFVKVGLGWFPVLVIYPETIF